MSITPRANAALLVAAATLAPIASREPTRDPATLARRLQAEVAELRGLAFTRDVPVEVIDDDRAGEHLLSRIHEFQTAEELDRAELTLRVLGLLPQRFDVTAAFLDAMREQAAGYYDPATGAFYLLDDVPEAAARIVMVHELTHALEDQHFDLDGRLRAALDDDDRLVAHSAIHEGSATLLMMVYLLRAMAAGTLDASALESFQGMAGTDVLGTLPDILARQLIAPYLLGPTFLARGNRFGVTGGGYPAADVDRVYREPPASSEQILHPEKYWTEERRDPPIPVALGDAGSLLGERFVRTATGVLGELGLGPLVGATVPTDLGDVGAQDGARWTNVAAAGWGGDRWELWQRGGAAVVLLLTVWDSATDAQEFLAGVREHTRFPARASGNRVALVAGASRRRSDAVLERLVGPEVEGSAAAR